MRIFVLQHGLFDRHSHAFAEAFGWRRALARRGLAFELLIHRNAIPLVVEQTGGVPVFPFDPMAEVRRDPITDELQGFLFFGESFSNACSVLNEKVSAADVVIIPHLTARELFGIARWVRTIPENRRPKFAFVLINPDLRWKLSADGTKMNGNISFFRFGANQLAEVLPEGRVIYCADNPILRTTLATVLNQPCSECALTIDYFTVDEVPGDPDEPDWKPDG